MKSFVALTAVVALAADIQQHGGDVGTPLKAILKTKEVDSRKPWDNITLSRTRRHPDYYSSRTTDNCVFPLDIVIVQDNTDSFSDNIAEMRNVQLKKMIDGLKTSHPNSRFAMLNFQDKALFPLGNRDDTCWHFNGGLSADLEPIYQAYTNTVTYGGADAPENQFGAIQAALFGGEIGWAPLESAAARLIVLITDAGPHHADDGSKPDDGTVLAPWTGTYSDARAEELCLKTHYPSAQQMYDALVAQQTYLAQFVFDGDWNNGWAANEWKSFNEFLAQPEDFVEPDANDSSNFFLNLSKVITAMEGIECVPETTTTTMAPETTTTPATTTPATTTPATTTPPTTTPATTATTTPATTTPATTTPATTTPATTTPATTATTTPATTTPATTTPATTTPATTATTTGECSPTMITDDCVPSADNCFCQPDVVIRIAHKPAKMNVVADDEVIANISASD